ncbi:interleukin-2 receptor subunit beta-like [Nerophis ophidion]|uniref:interleukin-2 receptor subunit beta-like n=1 Tax=Nerophis ophidion TaxID=159077 RepID=UPI002ADFD8BC|nr:interleukin-2 receptor subunit beta-like [Nerophis ophidion]
MEEEAVTSILHRPQRNMRAVLLFPLLSLLRVHAAKTPACPERQHERLICYNDYSQNITCLWNDTGVLRTDNTPCRVHAERIHITEKKRYYNSRRYYNASCVLAPVEVSTPGLKACSLIFKKPGIFQSYHMLGISLDCSSVRMNYTPYCHVKLYPPTEPRVNMTTVSSVPQAAEHHDISRHTFQLQWKSKDQPWNGARVRSEEGQCESCCQTKLREELLTRGTTYEARVRVRPSDFDSSSWSDWSPTASWTSAIGVAEATPSGFFALVLGITVSGTAFALFLAVLVFRTDRTTWVKTAKKIKGPPLPDPSKSFLQNTWVSPHFSSESLQTFFKLEEILPVKSVGHVDVFSPCRPELSLQEKTRSRYTGLSFFNPRYSQLWPPPVHSLTAGDLEPCAADSPYGPITTPGDGEGLNKVWDEDMENVLELLLKLSQGSDGSEAMPVVSDYAKIETLQVGCVRTPEEVSDEAAEEGSDEETAGKWGALQEFCEGSITEGSIQVFLDKERVHTLHDDSPELPSLDSGISSVGEEQGSQEESLEDILGEKSSRFRFPPSPQCSSSFTPSGLYGCLGQPLQSLQALLQSHADSTSSVEPSSGGYMAVCRKTPENEDVSQ